MIKDNFIIMKRDERAVSPIISTVLLIMIVMTLAVIILMWSRGFIKETITKDIGGEKKTVENFCAEINIKPILNDDGSFGFNNPGNIPIYAFNLKLVEKDTGNSFVKRIGSEDGGRVNPGFSVIVNQPDVGVYEDYEEVKIIPILLGKSKSGSVQEFECPEVNGISI